MIDIAIIGGGPAGLAAGLYAARGGKECVLFEEIFLGGQTTKTSLIENYPGFEDGVDGFTLTQKLEAQAKRFGLKIISRGVDRAELSGEVKKLYAGKETYEARTVILALGAHPRELGLPEERTLTGAGVSYCATCDGAFYRNRVAAVAGGGDTAASDALYLANFAKRVYLIHRRDTLRASAALQKAVFAEEKIEFVKDSVIEHILGGDAVTGLDVKNVKTGEQRVIDVDGLFVAVGITPHTELVGGQVELDERGYIVTDVRMQTSLAGVYAAGDARNTPLRQVVTAVADGAVAATSALEYLMV